MTNQRSDYSRSFNALSELATRGPDQFLELLGNTKEAEAWLSRHAERVGDMATASELMSQHNPKYILRNYMAQIAIEKAEKGDYSDIDRLLNIVQNPFQEHEGAEEFAGPPPDWAGSLCLSCSS